MNTKVRSILVPPAFVLLIVAVALLVLVPVASAQTTQPPLPVVVRSTTIINVPTDQPTRQAVQGAWNQAFNSINLMAPDINYVYSWAQLNGVASLGLEVTAGHTVSVTVNGQSGVVVNLTDAGIAKFTQAIPQYQGFTDTAQTMSVSLQVNFLSVKPIVVEQTPVEKLISFVGSLALTAGDKLIPGGFTAEELGVYAPQLDSQVRSAMTSFGITEADFALDTGNITVSEKGVVLAEVEPNWDLAGAFVKPGILPEYQQLVGIGVNYLKGTQAKLHFGLGEPTKDLPSLKVEPVDVVIGSDNSLTVADFTLPNNVITYVEQYLPMVPTMNVIVNGQARQVQLGANILTWESGSVKSALDTYVPGLMSGVIEKIASTLQLGVQIHRQGESLPAFNWTTPIPTPEVVVDRIGLQVAPDGMMAVNRTTVPSDQLRGLGVDPATISDPLQMALTYKVEQVSIGVRTLGMRLGGATITIYPNWQELLNVGMPFIDLDQATQSNVGAWTGRILPFLATRQGIYQFNLTAMPPGTPEPEGLQAILNWFSIVGALLPEMPTTTP